VRAQLAVWNAGTAAIAVGVPAGLTPLTAAGGALLVAGLLLFALALRAMERRSLQRAPWAARWYRAAACSLAVGAGLGPLIAAGVPWPHGSLLAAHLVLNVGGWFGTAIVGTLHTLYPSLLATRLRHPRLQPVAFGAWTAGIATLAAGSAWDADAAAVAGWALLLAAAAVLLGNLAASARAAERRPTAAVIVGAGQALLVSALALGLAVTIASGAGAALVGPHRVAVGALAVGGWVALTVAGSMLHLLALMARVRRLDRPAARPAERVPVLASGAVVAGAAALAAARLWDADGPATVAGAVLAVGLAVLGVRIALLAIRAVRVAPLRL